MCLNGWVGIGLDAAVFVHAAWGQCSIRLWQVGTPARLPHGGGTRATHIEPFRGAGARRGTSERSDWGFLISGGGNEDAHEASLQASLTILR